MRRAFGDGRLRFSLGDVRDIAIVFAKRHTVSTTFSMPQRSNKFRAVSFPRFKQCRPNVLGSSNVVNAAAAVGVESVVFLSTDPSSSIK